MLRSKGSAPPRMHQFDGPSEFTNSVFYQASLLQDFAKANGFKIAGKRYDTIAQPIEGKSGAPFLIAYQRLSFTRAAFSPPSQSHF